MEVKFYLCEHCGNLVEKVRDSGVPIICCGEPMARIEANVKEASVEKHIPVIKEEGDMFRIEVGSVLHPMTEEHYIEWILVVFDNRVGRFNLKPGDDPIIVIPKKEKIDVYAYCNIHGLWKIEK
jgi:superoxide reductase